MQSSLVLAFAMCLSVVFLVQIGTRQFIELPQLYAQEYQADIQSALQVKRAFDVELALKTEIAMDSAHWAEAYDFMTLEKNSPAYQAFVAGEYSFPNTVHDIPRVSGYLYLQLDGTVFFESNYNLETGGTGRSLDLPLESFLPLGLSDNGATASGFLNTPGGPVQFAISGITNQAQSLPNRGYLLVWRELDEWLVEEMIVPLGMELRLLKPEQHPQLLEAIEKSPDQVLPRNERGLIHWCIEDVYGQPLLVVAQATPPRTFYEGLFGASSIVGFSASALLLVALSLFVSRRVIRPITRASNFMAEVARSRDFSSRLGSTREDEVGAVAQRFDELLDTVARQDETLRKQNTELEKLSQIDPLTAISNRRVFEETLEQHWRLTLRSGRWLACIMIDVDYFKKYNDCYGHRGGDKILQQVAAALQSTAHRATDQLCRYGGEEFSVLLMDTEPGEAVAIAQRMVAAVRALNLPHQGSDCASIVTISAGVAAAIPRQSCEPGQLVGSADKALYKAKKAGRNRALYWGDVTDDSGELWSPNANSR